MYKANLLNGVRPPILFYFSASKEGGRERGNMKAGYRHFALKSVPVYVRATRSSVLFLRFSGTRLFD